MKLESPIVGSTLKEGAGGANSENAAINEREWMSGTTLKPLYARVPQILASALLIISITAYAQESPDKPVISLSTVSKLDRSQAGTYRTKVGKIEVLAVSDGTVGLWAILSRPTTCPFQDLGTSGKTGAPMPGCRLTT
jgi:hypothetical protein